MNCYLCSFLSDDDHGWWCKLKMDYVKTEEKKLSVFGQMVPACNCQVSSMDLEILRDEIDEELKSRENIGV